MMLTEQRFEPANLSDESRDVLPGMGYEVLIGVGCLGEMDVWTGVVHAAGTNEVVAGQMITAFDEGLPWCCRCGVATLFDFAEFFIGHARRPYTPNA